MSEKYTTPPPMQVIVPIGFSSNPTLKGKELEKFLQRARAGLALAYLEHGTTASSNWGDVERLFVIRKEQQDILTEENLDSRFTRVVMPNKYSLFASDRREYIRRYVPFPSDDTIRMVMDADTYDIGTNLTLEDDWKNTPMGFSRYLGCWVLRFQKDHDVLGVTFGGFNDRENRPGSVAGLYDGGIVAQRGVAQYGYAYFKEPLTFETKDCQGAYPTGWNFKEGAYRILDTIRNGGKTVRYFPVVHSKTRKASTYEGEEAITKLIEEFGVAAVLRKPPHGLNFGVSGRRRNKFRQESA